MAKRRRRRSGLSGLKRTCLPGQSHRVRSRSGKMVWRCKKFARKCGCPSSYGQNKAKGGVAECTWLNPTKATTRRICP